MRTVTGMEHTRPGRAAPGWVPEAAVLALMTALTGLLLVLVDAPLYNPLGTIDPWLYTALFTNFHFIYQHFWTTYYASRLPWVAPGLFLHDLFGDRVAFVILHSAF